MTTRIERCRMRCNACQRRTDHESRIGPLRGQGRDAFQEVEHVCQVCGHRSTGQRYPNLLADVFSLPATKREAIDEAQ